MMLWQKILWLAAAGAVGTLARYGLGGLVQRWLGEGFPWGTMVINVLGCFAFGVVWSMWDRGAISDEMHIIILIGFMGAFTTFSTYMFETSRMVQDREFLVMALNLLGQNVVGFACLFLGIALGRAI